MKILYCNHSVYNPGGMERMLFNKTTYLSGIGWEIVIVTTDQHGRPPFYPFPKEVKMIDLGINYSEDNGKSSVGKIIGYLCRRRKHKKYLTSLLMREKADVVVSLYPSESSFIPSIKDGSKKVLEFHYCKYFRLQYARRGLLGLIDRIRTWQDEIIVRKFDKFVTLTDQDREFWGKQSNAITIPNPAIRLSPDICNPGVKRIIAVGRLDYQKGFDRLVKAWAIVQSTGRFSTWRLDIYGQGEWRDKLRQMIKKYNIEDTMTINMPTPKIGNEYAKSSLLAMTSHYEGFPMVMLEAMAQGVPAVTFDFKCGPRDIIKHRHNGLIVPEGDIQVFALSLMMAMENLELRKKMSAEAIKTVERYSEENIMKMWLELFNTLINEK